MVRHVRKSARTDSYLLRSLLVFAFIGTLGLAAGGASASARTIADIENPDVEAKVLELDVSASRSIHTESWYASKWLSTEDWGHSLAGSVDVSLTEQQLPQIKIKRNPTVVSLAGELATEKAEGHESYSDFELCSGYRETTKSPRLKVTLDGFYRSGTSSSSGNPAVSLATQNLDPWVQTCSNAAIDTSARATRIETVSSPSASANGVGSWSPETGELTTVKDACTSKFCDFTITGHNASSATSGPGMFIGSSESAFTLRMRLEYPASTQQRPSPALDTKIVKRPRKLIKTRSGKAKISIRFKSTAPAGAKFKCRLDKGKFSACASPFKRSVGPGKHRFAVVSIHRGKADRSPAVYKWRVKKSRSGP